MKNLTTILLLLVSSLPAMAVEEVCTAIYTTLDGQEHWARVECDGPYAGKCLQEVVLKDGKHDWKEVACK